MEKPSKQPVALYVVFVASLLALFVTTNVNVAAALQSTWPDWIGRDLHAAAPAAADESWLSDVWPDWIGR